MNNANEPAFPIKDVGYFVDSKSIATDSSAGDLNVNFPGITKREYFAAMAMQGLLASWGQHDVTEFGDIAYDAVSAADALLSALNRKQSNPDQ